MAMEFKLPELGENIDSAARAMWNFGLDRMRIVAPRDGWPNPKAVEMASGAGRVLDHVRVSETTAESLSDLNYVFATTARNRDLTKTVMTPERAMEHARKLTADGQKVGVMFGAERAGLANEDIVQANALISVPVNPAFASLNLAQCVLLTAYEWRRQVDVTAAEVRDRGLTRYAEKVEVTKLSERVQERLDNVGFFWPEQKRESMVENIWNMLSRLPLTDADVRTLHGIFTALAERDPKDYQNGR